MHRTLKWVNASVSPACAVSSHSLSPTFCLASQANEYINTTALSAASLKDTFNTALLEEYDALSNPSYNRAMQFSEILGPQAVSYRSHAWSTVRNTSLHRLTVLALGLHHTPGHAQPQVQHNYHKKKERDL